MEFQVRYFALFLLFSVTDSFRWFWMGSLHIYIQLTLEFLKAPLLVVHFYCNTLMTFLMMLAVILLSMLMIILSNLSVIRHWICDNNQNWLLNLNLFYEKLWTGAGIGLLISVLEKLNWFRLTAILNKTFRHIFTFQHNFSSRQVKRNQIIMTKKMNVRVALQVAEQRKTQTLKKLKNLKKIPEMRRFDGEHQASTQKPNVDISL